jgi:predicted  nucleic acid-binding Zn-ribbon protein
MNQNQNELSITVDGASWPVSQLPAHIQQVFYIYQEWNTQLDTQRKEVFKLESAIRAISAEIEARIREHANEQRALLEKMATAKAEA